MAEDKVTEEKQEITPTNQSPSAPEIKPDIGLLMLEAIKDTNSLLSKLITRVEENTIEIKNVYSTLVLDVIEEKEVITPNGKKIEEITIRRTISELINESIDYADVTSQALEQMLNMNLEATRRLQNMQIPAPAPASSAQKTQ